MAGSVSKRPDGRYRARYRDDARKEHAKHFDTKRDAQRWLDNVTASKVTGQYVDPTNAKMKFRVYAEQWRSAQRHRPATARAVEAALTIDILPTFGDRPIGSIRPTEIKTWVRSIEARGLSASTVRGRFIWLNAILKSAATDRVIGFNPATGVEVPGTSHAVKDLLTTAEVVRIHDKTPEQWQALVLVMAGCGLRAGEATGLRRDQIDFLRRELTVDLQLSNEQPPSLVPVKTDRFGTKPPRVIPIPQVVVDALAAHIAKFGTGPDGVLFQNKRFGGYFTRYQFHTHFRKIFAAADAPSWAKPHDLRHFYASALIAAGEDVKVVQDRLGHASATMTLDTYGKIWPGREETTRSAIDAVFSPRADQLRTERDAEA
jgi:integrase